MRMKPNLNRLANTKNDFQGKLKKVLCVCSAGLLRSPTIAWVLSNEPYNCNTRACGVSNEYALIPIDEYLVEWADVIVCADIDHVSTVKELLKDINITNQKKPVYCLDLPDVYETRDPVLVEKVHKALKRVEFKSSQTE